MRKFLPIFLTVIFCISNAFGQTKPVDTDGDGYYNISTLKELRWVSENDSSWSWNFELDNDINAYVTRNWNNGLGWNPIGNKSTKFTGKFEGQGFEIKKLSINRGSEDHIGLFGYIYKGTVKNIGLIYSDISGKYYVGGLVGKNHYGIIENSYSVCSITGFGNYIGGLCGSNYYGNIANTYSTGTVAGKDEVGGLCGNNLSGSIVSSYSIGIVTGSASVGGFLGDDSYGNGDFSGNFWDTQTSGQKNSKGATGISTAQMKTKSRFVVAGWDFENIWDIGGTTNNGYPFLKRFTVGIEDELTPFPKNEIAIYPNPAEDMIYVEVPVLVEGPALRQAQRPLTIYDNTGNVVYSGNGGEIDISFLPAGVYFVRMTSGANVKTGKFVKR
jgi:hypothetical protein